ncbi:MAG: ComF family protein [Rhodospirillaceae bacterium]
MTKIDRIDIDSQSSLVEAAPSNFFLGKFKRAGDVLLDLLYPPQCLKCGAIVESADTLCISCWQTVTFMTPPWCDACGIMLEFDSGPGGLCAACARQLPVFARARSVFAYDDDSKAMILSFKYRDRTDNAPAYARWLARAGADLLEDADLLAPVPLHWSRLCWRRYNQSALLASALSQETQIAVLPDLLVRRRRTASLGAMSPSRRRRTLKGAIRLRSSYRDRVTGNRILLIDDVLTTRSTAQACARALLRAGASAVDVLTLARVKRPLPQAAS